MLRVLRAPHLASPPRSSGRFRPPLVLVAIPAWVALMAQTFPDTEGAVKAALKAALPVLGGRVFYAVPQGTPALPLVTLSLISGGPQEGESPLADERITFSVWGKTKLEASDAKRALTSWLRGQNSVLLDPTTFCYGVTFIAETWLPDDDAQLARYVVDATFTVRSA